MNFDGCLVVINKEKSQVTRQLNNSAPYMHVAFVTQSFEYLFFF